MNSHCERNLKKPSARHSRLSQIHQNLSYKKKSIKLCARLHQSLSLKKKSLKFQVHSHIILFAASNTVNGAD